MFVTVLGCPARPAAQNRTVIGSSEPFVFGEILVPAADQVLYKIIRAKRMHWVGSRRMHIVYVSTHHSALTLPESFHMVRKIGYTTTEYRPTTHVARCDACTDADGDTWVPAASRLI